MAQPILVTQSTSIVQVDTSLVTVGSPAVVLLSSLNAPGALITIRDIAGFASTNRGIVISTTSGVHFLDGPSCNVYTINQPYGFLTITPKAPTIWAVTNTFAFPDGSTAANVNQFTANFATISSLSANQGQLSTVAISTLSTDMTQVRYNLSVGQSTVADSVYVKGSLTALSSISTAGGVYATSVVTRDVYARGHIEASCIQVQQSTGYALYVGGASQFASTISTLRDLDVGGNISTQGNLVVGGSISMNGALQLSGTINAGNLSTPGFLNVGKEVNFQSTLQVKDNALFYNHVSIASSLTVAGGISTLNTLAASSIHAIGQAFVGTNLSVMSSLYAGGNVSIGGSLAVTGNLVFNDVLLDLNALSVFSTLTVGAMISTMGNIAAGQGLRVMGSTILHGLVSTASSMNVGGSLSTTGNLAVGGSVDFCSTLTVRGAVTKLGDVTIGGLLSTQSTVVIGDSFRVASNMFIGGTISSLSSINAAGNLLVGGHTFLSSGLSTLGTAAFLSSMQIQGSVSVMSSMVIRQNLTVQGTLNAAGFSLPGAAAVESIGVTTSTGVSAVFGGSTVQTGLLSTLGGIHMGGQFSTPNTITTGSTLNARFVIATSNISSLGSLGVGGDMSLGGRGTFCNLTVTSNLQTTGTSSNVFAGCNIFSGVPFFSNGLNGDLTQNYSMGNVTAAGTLQVSQAATFSNQVTAQSNITTASLTVTSNTLMSNFTSTLGQAAFFSSVAIQGNLSVFSSVNVSCNLNVGGILTAGNFQLPGGAILQTLAVTSNVGFTVNISSSTLHAGLFSTSGAIHSGREISTTSSILVGGIGRFQAGISTLGQAAFVSNVQVDGGLVSLSTVLGPSISAIKLQASSLGLGVANSLNQFDMVGTAAIQGSGRSNTLRLTATDQAPGITLSNTTGNYTLFNTKSADAPGAGALAILDNAESYRIVMLPGGNTAIGKASAAAPLDVNGLAIADRMGAPLAQFSTLGAATMNTSTLNVLSNINITAAQGGDYALKIDATFSDTGILVRSVTKNATLMLSNNAQEGGLIASAVGQNGEFILNAAAGDSIIRTQTATKKLLFTTGATNATLALNNGSVGIGTITPATTLDVSGSVTARTSLATARGTISTLGISSMTASTIVVGARRRVNLISGSGTNALAYAQDDSLTFTYVSGLIGSSGARGFATNGDIIVAFGNGNPGTPFATSFNGVTWTAGSSTLFTSVSGCIWDGRRFLACGNGSSTYALITSTDGLTWTEVTTSPSGVSGNSFNIAFNGSLYVMIFAQAAIYTSPDLITWTQRSSPFTTSGRAIAWTGTQWIAGGTGTNIFATSPNGITWTGNASLNAIFTASSSRTLAVFGTTVVVGGWTSAPAGVIAYSLDSGASWVQSDLTTNSVNFTAVEAVWWNGSYFLAAGTTTGGSLLATSPNGILWTGMSITFASGGHSGLGVTFSTRIQETNFGALAADSISTTGSIFAGDTLRVGQSTLVVNPLLQNVGINCNAPRFTLDVNGNINAGGNLYVAGEIFQGGGAIGPTVTTNRVFASTMTTSSITVTNTLLASNAANTLTFVSGANSNLSAGQLWRTSDGTNYTSITLAGTPLRIDSLAYNGRIYVAVGSGASSALAWQSSDGISWTQIVWSTSLALATTVKWNGQYWLIGGSDTTNTNRQIVRTFDLITFTNPSSGLPQGVINDLAWNGTMWVAIGKDTTFTSGTTQNIRYSFDGLNWLVSQNGFNASSSSRGTRILWSGTQFVAVGDDSISPIKYSYDGIVWYNSPNALSVFSYLTANCWGIGYNGKIYVATGSFYNSVADSNLLGRIGYSYDGITWSNALSNNIFTNRGFGVGWTGTQWIAAGQDSNAGSNCIHTSADGIYWTPSVTTNLGASAQLFSVNLNSNVIPDAQIGNTSFYSKQQPTFLTSTNTVQQFSNALILNKLYTDATGKVGINCNAPGGSALAVNGFVTMSNQAPINVVVIGTNDSTSANQLKYSTDYGQTWGNCILNPAPATYNSNGAIAYNGSYFLGAIFTSANTVTFYSSANGIVWNSNPMVGLSNMTVVRALCWAPPYWVVVGTGQTTDNSNTSIIRSLDGITWTRASSGGFAANASGHSGFGASVAFNGWRLVAGGRDNFSSQIKYSDDLGATWLTGFGSNDLSLNPRSIATNGRVWLASVMVGGPNRMMYSTDGANWVPTEFRFPGAVNIGIAWNGTVFVATGKGGNISGSNGTVDKTIAYSYDGINWSYASNPFIFNATAQGVVWTGRNFVATANWETDIQASTIGTTGFFRVKTSVDGITWTNVASTQNPTWTGVNPGAIAYSSNVYADLQVENLAIYGRNQFPLTQSTNRINVSNSNITINNGLTIASNGFMGYATTNPRAAFDVLGGGGANGLFVQTIAGSLTAVSGSTGNYATSALLNRPAGVAVDSNQNVYFSEIGNNRIRIAFSNGLVSTLAGSGVNSSVDGVGSLATFSLPHGIAIDNANANLYVCDYSTSVIRRVVIATGAVTTIAGLSGSAGFVNGLSNVARFYNPIGCIVNSNDSELYIADYTNNAIRIITLATSNVVTFVGSNVSGRVDATGTSARFNGPQGLAITPARLYIADNTNNMVRYADIATGVVSTIVGSPTGAGTTAGTAAITTGLGTAASVSSPQALALNPASNVLYIMNTGTGFGTMSAYGITDCNVSIFMNGGAASSINVIDGAIGTAKFTNPRFLTTDPTGNIYITEDGNGNRVRKLTSNYTTSIAALSFDYSGGGLSHYIRSRHMPTDGRAAENAIDFFLNTSFNTLSSISTGSGNTLAASITAAGVGIGTASPCNMLHIAQDLPYSYRSLNPLPAQMMIGSRSGTMKFGAYYTSGQGFAGSIQVSDFYWGRDSPGQLLINPLGGNVGIGTNNPVAQLQVDATQNDIFRARDSVSGNYIGIGRVSASFSNAIAISAYNTGGGTTSSGWKNLCFQVGFGDGSAGSGNVGIGTSAPSYPLVVSYNNAGGGFLESGILISNAATGNSAQLALQTGTTMWNLVANGTSGIPAGGFTIANCNTTRFVITSAGNVGIGTSNPISLLQLTSATVAGANTDIQFSPVSIGNGSVSSRTTIGEITFRRAGPYYATIKCIQTGYNDALDLGFTTDNAANSNTQVERMTIQAFTGNVGIGTTTPNFQTSIHYAGNNTIGTTPNYNFGLEVRNTVASGNSNRYNGIVFTDSNTTQASIGGYRNNFGANYTGGLIFLVGSEPVGYVQNAPANTAQASASLTEAMRITPQKNIFIGTTSPIQAGAALTTRLHVQTDAGVVDPVVTKTATSDTNWHIRFVSNTDSIQGRINGTGANTIALTSGSDKRLKENITPMRSMISTIKSLNPVAFKWKDQEDWDEGFIAQEMYTSIPLMRDNMTQYTDCECTWEMIKNGEYCAKIDHDNPMMKSNPSEKYILGLDHAHLTPYLTKGLQETIQMVEDLQKENTEIRSTLQALLAKYPL
jgi:hypothetical protein